MNEKIEEANNPVRDFSDKEIIKKFHWLQDNGMSLDQAVETIKEQTDDCYVLRYVDSYRNAISSNKSIY